MQPGYAAWRTPTLNFYMTDDFLCIGGSPRMSHAWTRVLGEPDSVETEEERRWWEVEVDESSTAAQQRLPLTTGSAAWKQKRGRGLPPPAEAPRDFTCTSIFIDVQAHGWVRAGASPVAASGTVQEEDPRPKVIGHVDGFKASSMLKPGSASAEMWEWVWNWITQGALPAARELKGIGYRRDFGAGGARAVRGTEKSKL